MEGIPTSRPGGEARPRLNNLEVATLVRLIHTVSQPISQLVDSHQRPINLDSRLGINQIFEFSHFLKMSLRIWAANLIQSANLQGGEEEATDIERIRIETTTTKEINSIKEINIKGIRDIREIKVIKVIKEIRETQAIKETRVISLNLFNGQGAPCRKVGGTQQISTQTSATIGKGIRMIIKAGK